MLYMTKMVNIRVDEEVLADIKSHAEAADESLTKYVLTALALRMYPPIIGHVDELPSDDARDLYKPPILVIRPEPNPVQVEPPPEIVALKEEIRAKVDGCIHKWRDPSGVCMNCGHKR